MLSRLIWARSFWLILCAQKWEKKLPLAEELKSTGGEFISFPQWEDSVHWSSWWRTHHTSMQDSQSTTVSAAPTLNYLFGELFLAFVCSPMFYSKYSNRCSFLIDTTNKFRLNISVSLTLLFAVGDWTSGPYSCKCLICWVLRYIPSLSLTFF